MSDALSTPPGFTRRAWLKSIAGLSAGTLALGLPGLTQANWGRWPRGPLPVTNYGSAVPTAWYRLAMQLVMTTPGFSPPVASRAFGYLGVALYEALVPGMPGAASLAGQLNELPATPPARHGAYHWPSVANSALAATMRALFPTATAVNQTAIAALEARFASIPARYLPHRLLAPSAERGRAVAEHIIYDLLRPITYIQGNIDPAFGEQMPLTTPPFPEYPSGHSVQTGAFAQVLFELFGDFPFTDHTHATRGLPPRSFSSCFEMAREAAISRLYGGIHYRAAIERGVAQGKQIGRQVGVRDLRSAG